MKILIVTGIFPPEIGGPSTYAATLGTKLVQQGHIVHVLTYSDPIDDIFYQKYPFVVSRIVRAGKASNYARFALWLLRNIRQYDVVYSLDWFSAGVPLFLVSILTGKKYIMRVGGGYIWEKYLMEGKPPVSLREFYERGLFKKYPLMYTLIWLVLKRAACIVFNSERQARLYTNYYGLKTEKIRIIYNPIEKVTLPVKRVWSNQEIVFAGRFIVMKNVESLIRAFARLKDDTLRLLLIGEGPTEERLRQVVEELNLGERVIWSPPLPREELYKRIINCSYVVLPSWTDISPNQIYECMALEIPFLLTKENYLAIDKNEFLKIDPGSVDDIAAKMEMLTEQNMYMQFVTDLQQIKFSYTWEEALGDHLAIFKEIYKI